ncbi:IPIL1 protein, partial [Halcyon senegalensis]|nr:IPIL1 protein [Halcyon senegalensis]
VEEEEERQRDRGSAAEGLDISRDLERIFPRCIKWPLQRLAKRSRKVEELGSEVLRVFQVFVTQSFFPVPQAAIVVGSAFEGWSPQEDEAVYCLLVPLKPPPGHTFHLELDNTRENSERNFWIHVQQECTCTSEQREEEENMLCFLHHPKKDLRRNQAPSLLDTLCTKTYLDVHKTAHWFQRFVRGAFMLLPQTHHYNMKVLPSNRLCKLLLTTFSGKTLPVEIIFGVQQGDSDVFVVSQTTEATFPPSTVWSESFAVAEVKLFRHMATQGPRGSYHLKCLHLCTRILVGTAFSTYILKTVVMHLLTTTAPSAWCRRDFLPRLEDIMRHLHHCLQDKRLDHFFLGNKNMPREINLPPGFQTAEPINLFKHLVQDPYAHEKALCEFREL